MIEDANAEIELTPAMVEAGVECFYDLPELLGPNAEQLRMTFARAFISAFRARPTDETGRNRP